VSLIAEFRAKKLKKHREYTSKLFLNYAFVKIENNLLFTQQIGIPIKSSKNLRWIISLISQFP
jgi:hypothetical protein